MREPNKILQFLITAGLAFCFACNSQNSSNPAPREQHFALQGAGNTLLFVAAVDLRFQSGRLSLLELLPDSLSSETILLEGISGDPLITRCGSRLFLFERSAGQQSVREILLKRDQSEVNISFSQEVSLSDLSAGDPHDAVCISDDHLVLANYVGHDLRILDLRTGSLSASYTHSDFEGDPDKVFRPENLFYDESKNRVFAIHQGFATDFSFNDSQSVVEFSLSQLDGSWDLAATNLYPINSSAPVAWAARAGDGTLSNIHTVGLCMKNFLNFGCKASVDSLTFSKKSPFVISTNSWNVSNEPYFYFGATQGIGNIAHAFVQTQDDLYSLIKFNAENQTTAEVISFGKNSGLIPRSLSLVGDRYVIGLQKTTGSLAQIQLLDKNNGEEFDALDTDYIPLSITAFRSHQ